MTLVYQDCACCGGIAGKNHQWWNQDHEYGVCGACAVWIAEREGWRSVFDCYGYPGVHWQLPVGFTVTEAFTSELDKFKEDRAA